MNAKPTNPGLATLATGVIVGSLVLTSLVLTGCDQISDPQSAASAADAATKLAEPLAVAAKLIANHNETFLVCPRA